MIRVFDGDASGFDAELDARRGFAAEDNIRTRDAVANIIADVAGRGDAAVLEYTNRFDRRGATSMAELLVDRPSMASAMSRIDTALSAALQTAAARIRDYHERQRLQSWQYHDDDGNLLGQRIMPIARVGVYVPGGQASYPSSVLMNCIPARVAGVDELIVTVPAPDGELHDSVLAAAHIAGVDRLFSIGGAQAVAALALGTASISRVDKIVGPGNRYVAEAKRQLFGRVGIDMIAGPSEIVVICDGRLIRAGSRSISCRRLNTMPMRRRS